MLFDGWLFTSVIIPRFIDIGQVTPEKVSHSAPISPHFSTPRLKLSRCMGQDNIISLHDPITFIALMAELSEFNSSRYVVHGVVIEKAGAAQDL
jgi:hypothetical protein